MRGTMLKGWLMLFRINHPDEIAMLGFCFQYFPEFLKEPLFSITLA